MEDKWTEFRSERYEIENIGRPAVFLIPSYKLQKRFGERTIENILHLLLKKHTGAFKYRLSPDAGFWTDDTGEIHYDECREYKMSFLGKEKIPALLNILASIAQAIREQCVYLDAGQYSALIRPNDKTILLIEMIKDIC